MTQKFTAYTDEQLRAYLAGEAEAELRAEIDDQLEHNADLQRRLLELDELRPVIAAASDDVLKAFPANRILPMVDEMLEAKKAKGMDHSAHASPFLQLANFMSPALGAALAACVVIIFAFGVVAGRTIFLPAEQQSDEQSEDGAPEWIAAVAGYMKLYTIDTVLAGAISEEERGEALRAASEAVALDLALASEDDQGLYFQKLQSLQFDGRALVQVAYLHDSGTPVALYVLARAAPKAAEPGVAPAFISGDVDGLSITYWGGVNHEFIVIGDLPKKQIEGFAESLSEKLN